MAATKVVRFKARLDPRRGGGETIIVEGYQGNPYASFVESEPVNAYHQSAYDDGGKRSKQRGERRYLVKPHVP